jgi:hypothetical protein
VIRFRDVHRRCAESGFSALLSKPTPLQEAAFNPLGLDPKRVQ